MLATDESEVRNLAALKSAQGLLPLHYFARHSSNIPTVKLLILSYPAGLAAIEPFGKPSEIANEHNFSENRKKLIVLLKECEKAWRGKDRERLAKLVAEQEQ